MAVTLCSVSYSNEFPTLADVQSYLGYSMYPVVGTALLNITFPETGRDQIRFEVIEFMDGDRIASHMIILDDGGTLQLGAVYKPVIHPLMLGLLIACVCVCGISIAQQSNRRLTSPLFDD
jgi:hypothetical protein